MNKTMILLLVALMNFSVTMADEVTVDNITIPQGGTAMISINLTNHDNAYTAGQMVLELPDGVTAVLKDNGDPTIESGERMALTNHSIGASHLSNGTEQFTIFSISSETITGNEGTLFFSLVTVDTSLAIGTTLEGRLIDIELTTPNGVKKLFNDQKFTITVGEPVDPRVLFDEMSNVLPMSQSNVDVRVRRTILANEWSTICLPFAMTEEQVKAAFGDDVELADFTSWSSEEDEEGAIVSINVGFTSVTAIEANHPYIVKVSEDISEFTVDGVDIDPEDNPTVQVGKRAAERGWMHGTYVPTTVPEENVFLSGNKFWYSTGLTKMKGLRAYFEFRDVLDAYYDSAEAKYSFKMTINGSDTITGIKDFGRDTTTNSRYYDMQGRMVAVPAKGIYVKEGKKVIIK